MAHVEAMAGAAAVQAPAGAVAKAAAVAGTDSGGGVAGKAAIPAPRMAAAYASAITTNMSVVVGHVSISTCAQTAWETTPSTCARSFGAVEGGEGAHSRMEQTGAAIAVTVAMVATLLSLGTCRCLRRWQVEGVAAGGGTEQRR